MATTKVVWVTIVSASSEGCHNWHSTDWKHTVHVWRTEGAARKYLARFDDDELSLSGPNSFVVSDECENVWVLFHFHDNYADVTLVYGIEADARAEFERNVQEQQEYLDSGASRALWDEECDAYLSRHRRPTPMVDDQFMEMSTIYIHKERIKIYPNKGDRWVLLPCTIRE